MSNTGRVAVITGAARGIGAATAARLAADGLAVGVVDLDKAAADNVADSINQAGGRALGISADVSDEYAVVRAVSVVSDELGPPTVVVNNAGITRDNLLFKMSVADWNAVIGVHLRGAFLVTRAVQTYMVESGWGRVINLSSTSALGNRGQANYSSAKAGIQGFTKTVAVELGKFGVTANCVAPGFIASDMTRATAERLGIEWDDYVVARAAEIPVRRAGEVDDIANMVSFFADERSGFVTGQTIYVAGGPKI